MDKSCLITQKKSAADALKTSTKRANQKTAATTGNLIVNKMSNKITRTASRGAASKSITSAQKDKALINMQEGIPKGKYVSPEKRQKIIDEIRLL